MQTHQIKKLFIIMILALVACSPSVTATATPTLATPEPVTPTSEPQPEFLETECTFEVPEGYQPRCGFLIVPEDRSQPGEGKIWLHVAIFKSTNPDPAPDPVIHLIGGPGGSALGSAQWILMKGGNEILEQRDYILFDQRGTEYSDPFLYCNAYDEYLWNGHEQDISLADYNAGALPFLESCLEEWRNQGVNLAAYNSKENAADVNDLRLALGYEQVNLYGTSYGSRLALEVMRDHPEGIRSVIIDSVFPPQANLDLEIAASSYRSLQEVFQACAANAACAGQYGDIETKLFAVINRLEAAPVQLELYGPYREQPYMVYLDGDLLIDTIFVALYSMKSIADIPYYINAAYDGAYAELFAPVGGAIGSAASVGLFWSTTCGEEVPFEIGVQATSEASEVPSVWRDHFTPQFTFDICELWNVPPAAPAENEAVASDIPTLIFAGWFDPVTPPTGAQLVAETLSDHYYYEFPNVAHGVMRSNPCALQMGLEFLDDPSHAPDSSCMNELSSVEFH